MDRCRAWESHADPEIRRVSKPGPEPIYPAYVVGDSDKVVEEIQVVAVTKPKSPMDQVEDLFRRLLVGVAPPVPVPAPVPEVPVVEKFLQHSVWWRKRRFASLLRWWRPSLRDWKLYSSQVKSNLFSNNIISTAITTNNRVLTYDN